MGTIGTVRKFAEQLSEISPNVVGVIVTHMDTVSWTSREFDEAIGSELSMEKVIYAAKAQSDEKLRDDLSEVCNETFNLSIDTDAFLKMFKIPDKKLKVLRSAKVQVNLFKAIKKEFDKQRTLFGKEHEAALLFEFQAWMTENIITAQKEV